MLKHLLLPALVLAFCLSFKAAVELYQHFMFSGEYRPWKTQGTNGYKLGNLASLKLGYEFSLPKKHSHMSPDDK